MFNRAIGIHAGISHRAHGAVFDFRPEFAMTGRRKIIFQAARESVLFVKIALRPSDGFALAGRALEPLRIPLFGTSP